MTTSYLMGQVGGRKEAGGGVGWSCVWDSGEGKGRSDRAGDSKSGESGSSCSALSSTDRLELHTYSTANQPSSDPQGEQPPRPRPQEESGLAGAATAKDGRPRVSSHALAPHPIRSPANRGSLLSQKRFYRQRAHPNPLSVHHLGWYAPPSVSLSEPSPPTQLTHHHPASSQPPLSHAHELARPLPLLLFESPTAPGDGPARGRQAGRSSSPTSAAVSAGSAWRSHRSSRRRSCSVRLGQFQARSNTRRC